MTRCHRVINYQLVTLLLFSIVACRSEQTSPIILATVGERVITLEDYRHKLREYYPDHATHTVDKSIKEKILNDLIEQELLLQEAAARNIIVTEAEVEAEIKRTAEDLPGQELEKLLVRKRYNRKDWQNNLRRNLLLQKVSRRLTDDRSTITKEMIQNYYDQNKQDFHVPEQVRALHILVESEQEAFEVLAQIRQGTPFETVARERSRGPEAQQGGDLGYFSRGVMPKIFDTTIFPLAVGKTSRVVSSEYGYHIFKLIDRKLKRTKALDECSNKIRTILMEVKRRKLYSDWLEKQLKKTRIMKNRALLAKL